MNKKVLFISIFIIFLISMGIIIYSSYSPKWKELPCGLWINKNGDIGFKTEAAIDEGKYVDFYIIKTPFEDDVPLKTHVDTATFYYMGGSFYKDKNHIYNYMPMSDGGNFYLIDNKVDYSTFEILKDVTMHGIKNTSTF